MKARVLHLIDSSGFYGAERVIVTLCDKLKETAFSPILGCIMAQHAELPEVGTIARDLGIEVVPMVQTNMLDWRCIKKMIHFHDISIIHCHGYKPTLLSYIAEGFSGRRIVITCHLWTKETLRLKIYALLESFVTRRANVVVAVSDTIRLDISRVGVRRKDIEVIFNGINLQEWQPSQNIDKLHYKRKIGLHDDSLVIAIFGRLNKQKGHEFLFEAIANLSEQNIEVICVGDGHLMQNLKALRNQLGLSDKVHFLGYREDVKGLLEITDIFVMPSLDEGLPMALLEAMAMRKPVVVTPVGAIPSVVRNRIDGIVVPRGKVKELEAAILSLIKDSTLREYIGRNARKKVVKQYSSEIMAGKYLEKYRTMVAGI